MLSDATLAEWRALADAATPLLRTPEAYEEEFAGLCMPVRAGFLLHGTDPTPRDIIIGDDDDNPIAMMEGDGPDVLAIARLMAASFTALPALLDAYESQRAELARLRAERDGAVAREREQCAVICDEESRACMDLAREAFAADDDDDGEHYEGRGRHAQELAAAIRARGTTGSNGNG